MHKKVKKAEIALPKMGQGIVSWISFTLLGAFSCITKNPDFPAVISLLENSNLHKCTPCIQKISHLV